MINDITVLPNPVFNSNITDYLLAYFLTPSDSYT